MKKKKKRKRRRGSRKLRWLEDVEKDQPEMKIKRRQENAVDWEEWASVIKEAVGQAVSNIQPS